MSNRINPSGGKPIRSFKPALARQVRVAAVNPFHSMIKLTDLKTVRELKPFSEKVLAMRDECFKYLPLFEDHRLMLRGDAAKKLYIDKIVGEPIGTSCVRNDKRTHLNSDIEKAFFLFSLMDEIRARTYRAIYNFLNSTAYGQTEIIPFLLVGFERFREGKPFIQLKPYEQRFSGQTDDIGRTIRNSFALMIPERIAESPEIYFPSSEQENGYFKASTRIKEERYTKGLFDPASGQDYMTNRTGLIDHYNVLLIARTILRFINSQI
jgi:hypothetical protein